MTQHTLNKSDLKHFTGTEKWYRHALNRKVRFTDGAKHVADAGGAYWLLDEIRADTSLRLLQPRNLKHRR